MARDFKQELTDLLELNFLFKTDDNATTTESSSIITLSSDPQVPVDSLKDRMLVVKGETEDTSYNILSNDGVEITTDHTFSSNGTISVEISDKEELISNVDIMIEFLSNTAPVYFGDFEIVNNLWAKYDKLVSKLATVENLYVSEDTIYNMVKDFNEFLEIDLDAYKYSTEQLNTFNTLLTSKFDDINLTSDELITYFKNVESLLADFNIAQRKIDDKNYIEYYNSRSDDSKDKIDALVEAMNIGGRDSLQALKTQYLNEIKITRS